MRKFILILGVCVLSAFVCLQSVDEQAVVKDVVLENVEALASVENSGSDVPIKCLLEGDIKCPRADMRVVFVVEGLSLGEDEETF